MATAKAERAAGASTSATRHIDLAHGRFARHLADNALAHLTTGDAIAAVQNALAKEPSCPEYAVLPRTREALAATYAATQDLAKKLSESEVARARERSRAALQHSAGTAALAKAAGELKAAEEELADVQRAAAEELANVQRAAAEELANVKRKAAEQVFDVKRKAAEQLTAVKRKAAEDLAAAAERHSAEQRCLRELVQQQTHELAATWAAEARAAAQKAQAREEVERMRHALQEARKKVAGEHKAHMRAALESRQRLLEAQAAARAPHLEAIAAFHDAICRTLPREPAPQGCAAQARGAGCQ